MADLKDELAEMLLENLGQSDEDIDKMEEEKFQRSLKYKTPSLDGESDNEEEEEPVDKSRIKKKR